MGEGGEEEGGKGRRGEGGRRGRRGGSRASRAAAAQPRLGGPGESGGPRREGGRRRAGGDSQTPVSLAAAERALPRPATAAGEFFTTPQSAAAGATLGLPRAVPRPRRPGLLGGRGGGAGTHAGGRVWGGGVGCCRALEDSPEGRGRRRGKSLRKEPGLAAAAGVARGGVGRGRDRGLRGSQRGHCCVAARGFSSGRGASQGEGAEGGAGARARGSGSGRRGAAPEAPGARPELPSCWRSRALQPGVRATAAAAGLSGPGREATAAPSPSCPADPLDFGKARFL